MLRSARQGLQPVLGPAGTARAHGGVYAFKREPPRAQSDPWVTSCDRPAALTPGSAFERLCRPPTLLWDRQSDYMSILRSSRSDSQLSGAEGGLGFGDAMGCTLNMGAWPSQ